MLAFKPKAEPILTQIAKSGLFQFMMVVVLGVGVTWFVIRTDRPQQWIQRINRFASVSINNPATTTTAQTTEAGIAEDEADLEAPPAAASAWSSRTMVASAPETAAATATAAAAGAQAADGATATQNVSTTFKMLEIDTEYLNRIVQQAQGANLVLQDAEVKIFTLPVTETISSVQNLNSGNMKVLLSQVSRANYGSVSRGFNLNMSLVSITAGVHALRLEFNKVHPNDNLQIPVEFNLSQGEKLVIAGNPLLSYFEFETDLTNQPPFQILKSADYRNQKTTFAIVIELQ